ncbi:MAG: serine hydrolase [Candidatus Eisenbacteria bacterium]|nr:serine hydrolase [Candidatus Eisenbacteria bacterium]
MPRRMLIALAVLIALPTLAVAAILPDSDLGRAAAAYFDAFNAGGDDAMRAFIAAHVSRSALAERSADERIVIYHRMRDEHRTITPVRLVREAANELEIAARTGSGATLDLTFMFETEAPHGLIGIRVMDNGPGGNEPEPASAPLPDDQAVKAWSAWLDSLARADSFSGAVLFTRGDQVLFQSAYGLASRKARTPNRLDTQFNLGSINKMFTSLAIAQLVEAGKVKLDDTIDRYLPDYPKAVASKVTVRELLEHRGGIGDVFGDRYEHADHAKLRTVADWIPMFRDTPLAFEPGTRQQYSNGGYVLLGAIVERASGEDYFDYIRRHVYGPLGMAHTDSYADDDPGSSRAMGYTRHDDAGGTPDASGWAENSRSRPMRGSPAGGGYSTLEDLRAFVRAIRAGSLLRRETLADFPILGPGPGGEMGIGFGGGAPGINAAVEMNGPYTIIVLANMDPPTASGAAQKLRVWLPRSAGGERRVVAPHAIGGEPGPGGPGGAPDAAPVGGGLKASHAADPAPTPPVLDRQMRATILDSLCANVMRSYVEADTARMVVDYVRRREKAGAYDALTSATRFAEAVTMDLRHVNGDLHLSLRWDPLGAVPNGGRIVVGSPGPGGPEGGPQALRRGTGGGYVVAGPAPGGAVGPQIVRRAAGDGTAEHGGPGGPDGAPGPPPQFLRDAVTHNFGLGRIEILPGNVGCLEITGFMGAPGSDEAIAAALRFLEHTDAIIFDVRRNRGGNGQMCNLLLSHFLPAEPVKMVRVKSRIEGLNHDETSVADVPGPRRTDVPLWVLTSRGTGSAAEAFSFVLKNLARATLVGERTAGASHMVQGFPLVDGFVAGVSITRVSDPRTGREWEGIGVQPDMTVEPERALTVAHAAALRKLIAAADDPARRRSLEMTLEWVEARDRSAPQDASRLAALVGAYEGEREARLVDGHLEFRRGPRMGSPLVAIGPDRFSMDGEARLEFAAGNPSPSVMIEQADGTRTTYARVPAGP